MAGSPPRNSARKDGSYATQRVLQFKEVSAAQLEDVLIRLVCCACAVILVGGTGIFNVSAEHMSDVARSREID